ncbi:MAG: response regulator transcription factor [Methylococcales bacterium]
MPHKTILIIEDNEDMAQLLALHLRDLQYTVKLCFDGKSGLKQITHNKFNLVILDLMLPGCDGLSICKAIRSKKDYTAIVMLTAKASELDRVTGLEMGADDYVTKPFSLSELLARIKALFRRMEALESDSNNPNNTSFIQRGMLSINFDNRQVKIKGTIIDLTIKEFELLAFFASHPARVYTRNELLNHVWGLGYDGYEHTVNSHINRLRVKIEGDPKKPVYIQTVWGIGYKFSESWNNV